MITLVCALALHQQQTISFTHPCAHSAVVLEKLGEKMGVKMAASGSVLQDFFAVRFTDRDPETIKRVIADTLNAVWLQRNDYLVLHRGPAQENAERERKNQALRQEIEKYLRERPKQSFDKDAFKRLALDAIAAGKTADLGSQEMRSLTRAAPDAIWGPEFVRAIGVDRMLAIEEGGSLRFKVPADGSDPLPPALASTFDNYKKDTAEAEAVLSELGVTSVYSLQPKTNPTYELSVSKGASSLSIMLRTTTVNALSGGSFPQNFYAQIARFGATGVPAAKPKWPTLEGQFAPSEPARTLIRVAAHNRRFTGDAVAPITDEEWDRASQIAQDLEANELLEVFGTLPLTRAAEQWKRDYVALVDDAQALTGNWLRIAENATLEQVWQAWGTGLTVTEDEASGVIKIYPDAPDLARANRFDRTLVSRFTSAFVANGRTTMDAAADLAAGSKDQATHTFNSLAAHLLLPTVDPGWGYEALRVYGTLNASQRRQAKQEDGLVLDWINLPIKARETILAKLNEPGGFYSVDPPAPVRWYTFSVAYNSKVTRPDKGLETVPAGTKLRVYYWGNTGIQPKLALPENDFGIYTAQQYAKYGAQGPIRSEGDTSPSRPDDALVSIIDAERLQVEVFVPGLGYTAYAAHTSSRTQRTTFSRIDKLPEPWKTDLAEEIKKLGGGGATRPSPTPVTHERGTR